MKTKFWIAIAGVTVGVAGAAGIIAWRLRDRRKATAGAMFVGAVDEVELGAGIARSTRADASPETYDPEELPSEHAEINELRQRMPFG